MHAWGLFTAAAMLGVMVVGRTYYMLFLEETPWGRVADLGIALLNAFALWAVYHAK